MEGAGTQSHTRRARGLALGWWGWWGWDGMVGMGWWGWDGARGLALALIGTEPLTLTLSLTLSLLIHHEPYPEP